jgi:hypothetical protein
MRHLRSVLLLGAVALSLASCGEKQSPLRTFDLGRRVTLGHLAYTVFDTQWLTQIGSGPSARVPQNRFFLVRLTAVNSASDATLVPNFSIEDDKGNSFEEVDKGDGVPQWIGFIRQAKPAESVDGNIVFDAPPRHYKLRLTDENGEHAALIDIPLNFASETPDAPVMPDLKPGTPSSPLISPGRK